MGVLGLRPFIVSPWLDVGASSRERPIMPAPGRAQGGWMNGARPARRAASARIAAREGVGRGAGGTQREGRG